MIAYRLSVLTMVTAFGAYCGLPNPAVLIDLLSNQTTGLYLVVPLLFRPRTPPPLIGFVKSNGYPLRI